MITKLLLSFFILSLSASVLIAAESTMIFNGTNNIHNGLTISFSTGNFIGSGDGSKMNLYAGHPEGNPINGGNDYKDISISSATYITRVTVAYAFNVAGFKLQFLKNNIVVKEISNFNAGGNITTATNFAVNKVVDVIRYLDAGASNSGAFELSQITFDAALPVELTLFTAAISSNKILLKWATATETNNYGFNVECTMNNVQWKTIGFIEGSGNSNSPKSYSFVDTDPTEGKIQYRLKQIDSDGKFEYSKTIEVSFMKPNEFTLEQNYPNPFNPSTKISWHSPVSSWQSIIIYDVLGNKIETIVDEFMEAGFHSALYIVNSTLPSGVYYYRLTAGSFVETKKLILMK